MTSRSSSPSISLAARTFGLLALALTLFGLGGACEDKHVGRPCELGTVPLGGTSGQIAAVSSPALECPSRICLLPGAEKDPRSAAQTAAGVSGTGATCTADCEENADCEDGEKGNAATRPTSAAAAGSSAAGRRPSAPSPARSFASAPTSSAFRARGLKKPSVCLD